MAPEPEPQPEPEPAPEPEPQPETRRPKPNSKRCPYKGNKVTETVKNERLLMCVVTVKYRNRNT